MQDFNERFNETLKKMYWTFFIGFGCGLFLGVLFTAAFCLSKGA